MRSMTGFGVGVARLGSGRVSVEIRSLNHRYLDVRVRLPPEAQDHTFFVEQACRERLTRGRYDVSVRFEGVGQEGMALDFERAKAAFASFKELRDQIAPDQEVPLSLLAGVPELFGSSQRFALDGARSALETACSEAVDRLDAMRGQEGLALQRELDARLTSARELCEQIGELTPMLVKAYQARLEERVSRLTTGKEARIEAGRLELEVALLADKSDITEELARLQSHFEQFATLTTQQEPVGRALDFLLQEMGREANTIGSKCQDTLISHRVVQLKAELERLREQVQNVE